ncbi:MAG: nickel pincer cofactor biosynthesis protein LarC [Thermoproteota archaeon]|nr:nickel pincer cofactor biosynthesis protein LarC [Thermoproteota archaeon]
MTGIVIIDPQIAGISGDMLLSGLIDLGADKKIVIDAIYSCEDHFKGSRITSVDFIKAKSNGISCTKFLFDFKEDRQSLPGTTMYRLVARYCDSLDLGLRPKAFVLNSLKLLISAESVVHGVDYNHVRLHETGSLDTVADLVGTAIAMNNLNLFNSKIFSTSVAVGRGLLSFSHGVVPNPGNAILEIFKKRGFILVPGILGGELTTPTGAAMLVNLSSKCVSFYPQFIPENIGYGGGARIEKGFPNVLRITTGDQPISTNQNVESVYEIETNVDDLNGESIGNLIEILYNKGAHDVVILQGITKKNRPVFVIKVISDNIKLQPIIDTLFIESGSLGIRIRETNRSTIVRSTVTVPVSISKEYFDVRVKVSKDHDGKITHVKPEFDDVKLISEKMKIPYRRSCEMVQEQVMESIINEETRGLDV